MAGSTAGAQPVNSDVVKIQFISMFSCLLVAQLNGPVRGIY